MTAPMMRARLHGHPCPVAGHGSRCERVDERRPVERAQEKRQWRHDADREGSSALYGGTLAESVA